MGLITWIVVGLIAGWLAGAVMKGGGYGVIGDIVIGVVGAVIGGFLAANLLGITNAVNGFNIQTLVVAFLGAVLLIWVIRLMPGHRSTV